MCPVISPLLLCCCVTLPDVSHMPMNLVHKYDHENVQRAFHQMLANPPGKSASWNKPSLHSLALSIGTVRFFGVASACPICLNGH